MADTSWTPTAAFDGAGSILLSVGDEAKALIPPGVLVLNPADSEEDFSEFGWRLVRWDRVVWQEARHPSLRVPKTVKAVDFQTVALTIQHDAPELVSWFESVVVERCRSILALTYYAEAPAEVLARNLTEADELRIDAAEVFGAQWVQDNLSDL